MRILVAVPTFENIVPETFKSIYDLDKANHDVQFEFVKGYDCAKARNMIVKKTLDGDYDYVLMVDSDIILPKDTLLNFLEFPVDICFGLYPHKNNMDGMAEVYKTGQQNFAKRFTYKELTVDRMQIKGAGFGCAFVHHSVFLKLKYPWFKYVSYDSGTFLSEDLYFCSEASKAGYELYADTRIKCGHLYKYFKYD